ncbi:histidine phosphatase family protein [Mucilaginibacter glaciei]|uniref:Histidine phosphatase family protein n=1 Tax=Mucilaginibacter glaciei TaxID=2772109 RepID=A0A926S6T2_9SPHI|nr:histidine phosphatase family protein [Mucilaginibacter glaciei]MBD1394031.1 histidine phosphatase family protein [Mucilaginibacter glaciei]
MRNLFKMLFVVFAIPIVNANIAWAQSANLKVVFIRHAEKPVKGDNLTCQGYNRSVKLPAVIIGKFGVPAYTYVPTLGIGEVTKHARMFETIVPLAAKYNLTINSARTEKDTAGVAADIKTKSGIVLVAWNHKTIAAIIRNLGVKDESLVWPDDDYDTIWIVSFKNGVALLTRDKENINPGTDCNF